jgi:pimeloyl-ACP methyl ester carboxylesterase
MARGRWRRQRLVKWAATVAVVVGSSTGLPASAQGDQGRLIDVGGGRHIYLQCAGSGSPTVIFESGYPNNGEVWSAGGVFQAVSELTRACVYDRPGTAWQDDTSRSDPAPQPRTARDVVADLDALLQASGEPRPYVLVAHSIGGLFARLFASSEPGAVAGLVLVDTTSEYQVERLAPITPPEFEDVLYSSQRPSADVLAVYPQIEQILINDSSAQVRDAQAATPLREMPLVVLTHGRPLGVDGGLPAGFPAAAWEDVIGQLQRQLASLVPGGRQVIATDSGHYIQLDQPDLVIAATRSIVDAVRAGESRVGATSLAATGTRSVLILLAVAASLIAAGVSLRVVARRRSTSPL